MYRNKEEIANNLLKDVVEYYEAYQMAIPLRILSAKYNRALSPMSVREVIQILKDKGLVKVDLSIQGTNYISPTKDGIGWFWL